MENEILKLVECVRNDLLKKVIQKLNLIFKKHFSEI